MTDSERVSRLLPFSILVVLLPWWVVMIGQMVLPTFGNASTVLLVALSLSLLIGPFLVVVELLWTTYFIFAGGSLFNNEMRRARGKGFEKLKIHGTVLILMMVTYYLGKRLGLEDLVVGMGSI